MPTFGVMQTLIYRPLGPLAQIVEVMWHSEAGRFDYANLTLPMLQPELVINFSDQFAVRQPGHVLVQNEVAWLAGLQTRPIHTTTQGRHRTAGVLLKPWGLYALTGMDAFHFRDQAVGLETVWGPSVNKLIDGVHEQADAAATFGRLERFLLAKLSTRNLPAYLLPSLHRMQQAPPTEGLIHQLATEAALSPKALIQGFKKYTGLTPGKLHHLLLLQQSLRQLIRFPDQKLTQTGYDLHFFDQAHFIRFFKQYTGFTPSAYVQQYRLGNIPTANPHTIALRVA